MAILLDDRYPGRANPRSLEYPQGSFKDRTSPDSQDGTYLQQDWANDIVGFLQYLLSKANIQANGAPDTAIDSQYAQALQELVNGWISETKLGTATTAGFAQLATAQEATNKGVNNRVLTPQSLAQAFDGANRGSGWQKLPNGMIIQGGNVDVTSGQTSTFSFPIAFANKASAVVVCKGYDISEQEGVAGGQAISRTQFRIRNINPLGGQSGIQWMAWGY